MTKKKEPVRDVNAFFRDEYGQIQYAAKCKKCRRDCRQSFRVRILSCPIYEDYRDETAVILSPAPKR